MISSALMKTILLAAMTSVLLVASPVFSGEKLRVFILAGQSNMVGHARAHTIATLLASDKARDKELLRLVFKQSSGPSKATFEKQLALGRKLDELTGGISFEKIKALSPGPKKTAVETHVKELKDTHEAYKQEVTSSCVVSDRVYINSIADRNVRSGKLAIGYGGDGKKIGPEYAFGLSIAEKIDGPILIIKTSWGGKSLNYNFRPPSAGTYELSEKEKSSGKVEEIRKNASLNWRMMNEAVHAVLDNLKDNHPEYNADAGYEIAGFVWFQGFNDQFSPSFRDNYKANMVSFIKDVRKEYRVPNMPFVIGVLGTGVTAEKVAGNAVSVGQREAARTLGFTEKVAAVESYTEYSHFSNAIFKKGWPKHFHEWDTVGSDRPYHYLGSGAFFVRLGAAFADSMTGLMEKKEEIIMGKPFFEGKQLGNE